MQNHLLLYFTNVQLVNDNTEKNYTFVSLNEIAQNIVAQSFKDSESRGMTLRMNKPNRYPIDSKNNAVFYKLCQTLFKDSEYVKYNGLLPLDSSINYPSFKKNILFKNSAYDINKNNEDDYLLEKFLKEHNILESYYYNKVSFKIKCVNSEFSYEYGNRDFVTQYETERIDSHTVQGIVIKRHACTVYSNKVRESITAIIGKNDDNQSIDISFNLPIEFIEKEKKNHLTIK